MDKENFKNHAKKTIDDIFEKIDELEVKKDKALGQAKTEFEEKIIEIKNKISKKAKRRSWLD